MIRIFTTCFCLLAGFNLFSQNLKTDVLVVGSTSAAISAAVQSSRSGVKTILLHTNKFDEFELTSSDKIARAGLYAEFLKRADTLQKKLGGQQPLISAVTAQIFKGITDTVKNLTVLPGTTIKKIERSGKNWEVDLSKGQIKAHVIVDATNDNSIITLAMQKADEKDKFSPLGLSSVKNYRTSVALSNTGMPVPLTQLLESGLENIISAKGGGTMNLLTGQAAGATAAYCAFFKTTSQKLSVRKIQNELLLYKSRIMQFEDIQDSDSSFLALQHIGVTGILAGKERNGKLYFVPEDFVSIEDIKQPLKEYYSRSQIWFLDNKEESVTLGMALSLVRFLATRGDELNREVERAWGTSLKVKGPFDLKRVITRRELAILFDTYLKPFSVEVDLDGSVKR